LLAWAEDRAREVGSGRLGQNVSDADTGAVELLTAKGYEPKATLWLLEIVSSELPSAPILPAGISVRPFRAGDEQATYEVVEGAFGDWQERRHDYEEWAQNTIGRASFAPQVSPLAFDGDILVGAVISLDLPETSDGYVERVAVSQGYRGRGIARALLQHAFREFYVRGKKTCFLYTHSETGALSLYERAGMTVRSSGTHFSKALG
jgi:ribosomal protein S18 acetylase RimI-like enzyme